MSHKSFPKEGMRKLKETVRDLKALLRKKDREITFLRNEIENLVKPVRERKPHQDRPVERSHEEWKKDFLKRFRKEVLGKDD